MVLRTGWEDGLGLLELSHLERCENVLSGSGTWAPRGEGLGFQRTGHCRCSSGCCFSCASSNYAVVSCDRNQRGGLLARWIVAWLMRMASSNREKRLEALASS